MKSRSLYPYFYFGTCVRYLQDADGGRKIHGYGLTLENLDFFFESLEGLNLQVTRRAAAELKNLRDELAQADEEAELSAEQARKLVSAINDVRNTLEAELQGFNIYVVTPKRIDMARLLTNVENLFAPKVFDKLPDIARFDLSEAGKCIAFERPTAAAFHLMRATEAVLREFYCQHVRRNRVDTMWGPIVQDLRKKKKFLSSPEYSVLLNNLDNIRHSFRNPTQHPDKIYDIQEVQDLWGLCVEVINRMSKDLPEADDDEVPF